MVLPYYLTVTHFVSNNYNGKPTMYNGCQPFLIIFKYLVHVAIKQGLKINGRALVAIIKS